MAGVTTWPARRVGNRILCGRPAPNGGCRGEIARIRKTAGPHGTPGYRRDVAPGQMTEDIKLPFGLAEDPPGSGNWRLTRRAARRLSAGRKAFTSHPRYPTEARADLWHDESSVNDPPGLPFRRPCPTCGVLALVTADLLSL